MSAMSNARSNPTSNEASTAVESVEANEQRSIATKKVARRGFEELVLGEVFSLPKRTITSAHFDAFQALSGDDHPMHYDRDECIRRGHADLLAHGLQVVALGAAGAGLFPYVVEKAMLGFIEQTSRFVRPVVRGDTLRPTLTVAELRRQRTTGVVVLRLEIFNQDDLVVLEGSHSYLLRLDRST